VRLIDPGASEQDTTRRRAALSEFSLAEAGQTRLLQEVIDAFIAVRLLTTNEIAGTTTIEVSHEALIREWPRLAGWLREARDDIPLQQTISKDATEWEQRNKPGDRLYRGSKLKEARAWARRNTPSGNEVAFLHAGAASRARALVRVIAVVLLLISAMGVAGWFYLNRTPDFTRVTTLNDDGIGSLRWAIANAPVGGTITFNPRLQGTIRLTSGDLNINKSLHIRGLGADILAISSSRSGYQVYVNFSDYVTITGLTFKQSKNVIISNHGTLILSNSTVSGITADGGGGIFNDGKLTITNSTVSGNTASGYGYGGGISNDGGILTLSNSTVSGNTAQWGGGIYNTNSESGGGQDCSSVSPYSLGTLTLSNSTVSDNISNEGGGIDNEGGILTLSNSTILGNKVSVDYNGFDGGGGAIYSSVYKSGCSDLHSTSGRLTLNNSTISGNTSQQGGGIMIGDIQLQSGRYLPIQADLTFSTIYGNTAHGGGDIAIEDGHTDFNGNSTAIKQRSRVKIRNSIVAGDPAHPGPDIVGMLTSYSYNLFQGNSGATFDPATSTQHGTDKTLSVNDLTKLFADPVGPRYNGGLTKTYALALGSPALDQIPLDACHVNSITTDQRNMKRPDDHENACDIGASELNEAA